MNAPLVSVGMPVFNGEKYIEEAIQSYLRQDYADLELIVGDNGSTDATAEIVRDVAARDPRVSFHRSEVNHGAAWNYNRLVPLARGRYFKWASHDDMVAPTYVARCKTELDESPEAVIAFPKAKFIDAAGNTLRVYDEDESWDIRGGAPHERLQRTLRVLGLCNPIFGLMRLDVLRTTGLIGSFDSSDIALLSELALRGEFHLVDEPLFLRRMHDDMSRRALRTPEEVAKWFDTKAKAYNFPWTRLFAEHIRLIDRAPIPAGEKAKAARVLATEWHWRKVARETKHTVLERIGRRDRNRYERFSERVEAG